MTLNPPDVPSHVSTARVLLPLPPTAIFGIAAEVLVIVVRLQLPPNNLVDVSTLPDRVQPEITSPALSTQSVGEAAPVFDNAVETLQLLLNGLEAAFTTPFSSQMAVALPLLSTTIRGADAPVAERVTAEDQLPETSLLLALTKLFSTHAATELPLGSTVICGSEALRPDPDRVVGGVDQVMLLL